MPVLDNAFFRAMNRLDERINARLSRSWMGRLGRRIETRLARPDPPLSELSPEVRNHVSWVLTGRIALDDPALMPYLRGRVRAYRRGMFWLGTPAATLLVGFSALLKTAGDGWPWGSLIWAIYPFGFGWLTYIRARRATQAHESAFGLAKGTASESGPIRRGLRGRTS